MSVQEALIEALAKADLPDEKDTPLSDDIVAGARGIARYLFGSDAAKYRRKVYNLSDPRRVDRLPVFRIGHQLYARKSTLKRVIAEQESRPGIPNEGQSSVSCDLSIGEIISLTGGKLGRSDVPCPFCGPRNYYAKPETPSF